MRVGREILRLAALAQDDYGSAALTTGPCRTVSWNELEGKGVSTDQWKREMLSRDKFRTRRLQKWKHAAPTLPSGQAPAARAASHGVRNSEFEDLRLRE